MPTQPLNHSVHPEGRVSPAVYIYLVPKLSRESSDSKPDSLEPHIYPLQAWDGKWQQCDCGRVHSKMDRMLPFLSSDSWRQLKDVPSDGFSGMLAVGPVVDSARDAEEVKRGL